jgi:hypothetical protein
MAKVDSAPISAEERALARLVQAPRDPSVTKDLDEFVDQQREIFAAQLAIDARREELKRLAELEREEEETLRTKEVEINLFRDQFRSFLEADAKATMIAREEADAKAQQRMEVSAAIRSISQQILSLKRDISRHREGVRSCKEFRDFLETLTPEGWHESHPFPAMYFTDPAQLLEMLRSLEEHNMFLMRHCQEADDALDRHRRRFNALLTARDETLAEKETHKNARAAELNDQLRHNEMYRSAGEIRYGNEIPEPELAELQAAVSQLHSELGFDPATSKDIPTMLRRIERKMEEMEGKLGGIDSAILREGAQRKEVRRRDDERTEKSAREKKELEEKAQRAIQQAMKPIKRKTGRPLVERIVPPKPETREKREETMRRRQEQERRDADLLYGPVWD